MDAWAVAVGASAQAAVCAVAGVTPQAVAAASASKVAGSALLVVAVAAIVGARAVAGGVRAADGGAMAVTVDMWTVAAAVC